MSSSSALLLVTSADKLSNGHSTGYWFEELAAPYFRFKAAGFSVTIASVSGGEPPCDKRSFQEEFQSEDTRAFSSDTTAQKMLQQTPALSSLDATSYNIVFCVGGHGTCVDFDSSAVGDFCSEAYKSGCIVAAVCHGSTALVHAKDLETNEPLVKGKRVTCFTDNEEKAIGLAEVIPYLLEAKLRELGAVFECSAVPWTSHAVADGRIVTGQNPNSSSATAELALKTASTTANN